MPIFPELRPYLEEVFDHAEPGSEYVITRYRKSNVNLRTQLLKIIGRAGLVPWPKLWQNLLRRPGPPSWFLRGGQSTRCASGWAIQSWWPRNTTGRSQMRTFSGRLEVALRRRKSGAAAHATPRKTSHVPLGTSEDDYQNILPCNILRDNSRPGDKSWVPNDLPPSGRHWTRTSDFHRVRLHTNSAKKALFSPRILHFSPLDRFCKPLRAIAVFCEKTR